VRRSGRERPADARAVERACHGWHALDFQAKHDSAAQKAGLDGYIVRADGEALHKAGKHKESEDALEKGMKILNIK